MTQAAYVRGDLANSSLEKQSIKEREAGHQEVNTGSGGWRVTLYLLSGNSMHRLELSRKSHGAPPVTHFLHRGSTSQSFQTVPPAGYQTHKLIGDISYSNYK